MTLDLACCVTGMTYIAGFMKLTVSMKKYVIVFKNVAMTCGLFLSIHTCNKYFKKHFAWF